MSFGQVEQPKPKKKLLNISDQDYSTNQQAVLGTYFAGVAKLPLTWISPPYNVTSKKVKTGADSSKASSKGGVSAPPQLNWYADIAGWACVCPNDAPVDTLINVLVNNEVAFTGPLTRVAGSHNAGFSLETYCQEARIYWGTKDQPIDDLILTPRGPIPSDPNFNSRDPRTWPKNNQLALTTGDDAGDPNPLSGHYDFHGAYRNQCYFVFKQFFLGASQNQPSVVVVLSRGALNINTGNTTTPSNELGVPPLNPVYEIVTDDMFGAGKSRADLDIASWVATNNNPKVVGNRLSPVVNQAGSFRNFLADYVQYGDFWFRRKSAAIEAGFFPHGYIDPATLPAIANDDLTAEPKVKPIPDRSLKNHFRIVYTNREAWYNQDGTLRYINNANITRSARIRREVIQRPHVIDKGLAQQQVTEWGTIRSADGSEGSLEVKRETALSGGWKQGSIVNLQSAAADLAFVIKILQLDRGDDRDGTFKCTFESHRANWPIQYIQPPDPKDPDFEVYSSEITQVLLTELPSGLKEGSKDIALGVLARRPTMAEIGFHVFFSLDNGSYIKVQDLGHFAVYGKVTVLYPDTTTDNDATVGMQVDLYGPDLPRIVSQTLSQRDDYNLLIRCETEWASCWTVTPVAGFPGRVKLFQKRAIYGTVKSNHEVGQEVWLAFRSELQPIFNKNFTAGVTRWFKFQPYTIGPVFPLEDCEPVSHVFSGGAVSPITGLALAPSFVITSEGKVDARVDAAWDYPLDQDIATFDVSFKRHANSTWTTVNAGGDPAFRVTLLDPDVLYDFRVRALSAAGEPSAWSATVSVTTSSPAVPGTPTGLTTTPGTKSVGLMWTPASTGGIAKTQIGRTLIPTFTPGVLVTLTGAPDSFVVATDDIDLGYFYAVRHLNTIGDPGDWSGLQQGLPLTTIGRQCATPLIGGAPGGSGTIGTANFRVLIVDMQGADGPATLYFSVNNGPWLPYSKTGNYKSSTTGAVLPIDGIGAISCGIGDKVVGYAVQEGWMQSATSIPFINNATNAPNRDGDGTVGGGTPIARLP